MFLSPVEFFLERVLLHEMLDGFEMKRAFALCKGTGPVDFDGRMPGGKGRQALQDPDSLDPSLLDHGLSPGQGFWPDLRKL